MKKFSKLKPKEILKKTNDKILYENDYIKVIDYEDWSIIKERDLIICIPYFIESNEFLLRHEYIPTYKYVDGQEYHITVLSGGIEEGETVHNALYRELEEEAGIIIREDYQIEDSKPLFITKGHVNKYNTFILPLNEKDYEEIMAKGDGSKAEELSKSVRIDARYIDSINTSDLITEYMLTRLKEYLNLIV